MTTPAITLLGLGPGNIDDLTVQALDLLKQAAAGRQIVYFRTTIHPTVRPLQQRFPDLSIVSFDKFYDESNDWNSLYLRIAEEICRQAEQQPVIYAVPGHPLIGEASVQLILRMARERRLTTGVVAGLSFLEPVCAALALDPFEHGTQLIDATELATLRTDEVAGRIIPTKPLLIAQLYNRRLASQVKLALSECYADEWPVRLVRAAGVAGEEQVIELPLFELDRDSYTNHLSTLYVPPVDELTALRLPETLRYITMRLRREPDGCPWDRQQTHQTLTRYVIEETYEVVEALEENDPEKLAEELGDLLLQVYLHAEIARQAGEFSLGDVFEHVNAKLIRRHPHVFGDVSVSSAGQVIQNWEEIKRQERARAGKDVQNESALERVPLAAPALTVAQKYQKRVSKIGFEFDHVEEVYTKIAEELAELRAATSPEEQLEEIGDLLFMIAKLARWHKIDAEEALRRSNRKFRRRFQAMEERIRREGSEAGTLTSQQWETLWEQAKKDIEQKAEVQEAGPPPEPPSFA
ncbi:MAG: nucleoside triphosphate pyrophosphohydrolase [Ktedonobacteraceae bacterium]|nr:nucleoside triphosphate pyrophosphohydrolase [Ktedonobacteraceae bacterium]